MEIELKNYTVDFTDVWEYRRFQDLLHMQLSNSFCYMTYERPRQFGKTTFCIKAVKHLKDNGYEAYHIVENTTFANNILNVLSIGAAKQISRTTTKKIIFLLDEVSTTEFNDIIQNYSSYNHAYMSIFTTK